MQRCLGPPEKVTRKVYGSEERQSRWKMTYLNGFIPITFIGTMKMQKKKWKFAEEKRACDISSGRIGAKWLLLTIVTVLKCDAIMSGAHREIIITRGL